MNEPKLWQVILYPSAQVLAGFAIVQNFDGHWANRTLFGCFAFFGIMTSIFMILRTVQAVGDDWMEDARIKPDKPIMPKQVPVNLGGMAVDTSNVRLDVERNFARKILDTYQSGADVKLTETYWIKEKRWEAIGGRDRNDFSAMLARWCETGIAEKKNHFARNSTYKIVGWGRVARKAEGKGI